MRVKTVVAFALLVMLAFPLAAQEPIGPMLQRISVNITCPSSGGGGAQGSGTIVLADVGGKQTTWIVTAHHVVKGLREVKDVIGPDGEAKKAVRYKDAQVIQEQVQDGRAVGEQKYDAKVVSVDPQRDIALLRVRIDKFTDLGVKFYMDDVISQPGTALYHCLLPDSLVQGDFYAGFRSFYDGQAIEIVTKSGAVLRVTENHPILTEHGFVAAGLLQEGDKLFRYIGNRERIGRWADTGSSQIYDQPTPVKQVFDSLAAIGFSESRRAVPRDFHGDGHFIKDYIYAVRADPLLPTHGEAIASEDVSGYGLERVGARSPVVAVHGSHAFASCIRWLEPPSGFGCFTRTADQEPRFLQVASNSTPADTVHGAKRFDSLASPISLEQRSSWADYYAVVPSIANDNASLAKITGNTGSGNAQLPSDGVQGHALAIQPHDVIYDSSGQLVGRNSGTRLVVDERNLAADQPSLHGRLVASDLAGNGVHAQAGTVEPDNIVHLRRFKWSGHVYDLSARDGLIIADSLVVSNCGAPGGKDIGGTCSLTSGIISRIGVRIPEFGGSEHGVFDQTDTAALGGSSGGLLALTTDGRWVGMITLGLSGDSFHWFVPVRSVRAWAKQVGVEWLLDPAVTRPSEVDIDKIPLELDPPGFKAADAKQPTPAPAAKTETELTTMERER